MDGFICCRTCFSMKLESYSPLDKSTISIIEECVAIKIDRHVSSTYNLLFICDECKGIVLEFHKFKIKCHQVNPLFENYIKNQTVEVETKIKDDIPESNFLSADVFLKEKNDEVLDDLNEVYEELKDKNKPNGENIGNTDNIAEKVDFEAVYPENVKENGKTDVKTNQKKYKFIAKLGKDFKCNECDREYRYIKSIVKHYSSNHTDVKPELNCQYCDLSFRFQEQLQLHEIEIHLENLTCNVKSNVKKCSANDVDNSKEVNSNKKVNKFNCQFCPKSYSKEKLKRDHEKLHGDSRFFCAVCNKGYPFNGLLTKHYKQVHPEVQPMQCKDCTYMSYEPTRLERHQLYEHGDSCPKCNLKRSDTKQFVDHVRRCLKGAYNVPQSCQYCGRHYNHLRSLMKHVNLRHNAVDKRRICEICGTKVFHIKLHERIHLKDPQQTRFQKCGYCGEQFETRMLLFRHHKAQHPDRFKDAERKFDCEICRKKFTSRQYLRKHKRIVHDSTYKVKCSVCDRPFKTNSDLKRHMQSHTNDRRYQCHMCDKRYFDNAKLQGHLRTHSGERPFVCTICNKTFSRKDTLRSHMRTNHVA